MNHLRRHKLSSRNSHASVIGIQHALMRRLVFKAESAPQTHLPLPHTSQRRARRVRTTASARATDAHTHRPHKRGRLQRAHGGRGREGGGERQPGAARWSPRDGCGHHHSTRNDARGYTRTVHEDAQRMRSNRMRRMAGGHTRTTDQGMEAPARPPCGSSSTKQSTPRRSRNTDTTVRGGP